MPRMVLNNIGAIIALCCAVACNAAVAATPVIYPSTSEPNNVHWVYPLKLLELSLKKSGGDYVLQPSAKSLILQGRAILSLERNDQSITLMWTMTDKEREAKLLPIRIPIYKGLIGWRIPLVNIANRDLLKNVKTAEDLAKFTGGQGHDWPDTDIMRANGLPVVTSSWYQGLFNLVSLRRIDYFPRPIAQVWWELNDTTNRDVVADSHIVLHYPAPFYFFVSKKNTKLAADLERGLNLAIADGSFDKLFNQYHADAIARANVPGRTVITLKNPYLPPETPLHRPELWLDFQPRK